MQQNAPEDARADIALLNRVIARDAAAIGELYDRHSRLLFGLILRILRDRSEAEEVLQEVFVQVWTRADTYNVELGVPAAWLVRIARNRAIDRLRANTVRARTVEATPLPPPVESPETRAALSEQQRAIARALDALPPEQRQLIECAYFQGLTQSELAERFSLPLGTVKTRVRTGTDDAQTRAPAGDGQPMRQGCRVRTSMSIDFEDLELPLAEWAAAGVDAPGAALRDRIMARVLADEPSVPAGFAFSMAASDSGCRTRSPASGCGCCRVNRESGYATLLLDVKPGTRFPPHHHAGAEECYVVSGASTRAAAGWARATSCTRTPAPTTASCGPKWAPRCMLIVPPDDDLPSPAPDSAHLFPPGAVEVRRWRRCDL